MTPRGVLPWDIQVGPFEVDEIYFWKISFHFINKPCAAFPFPCIEIPCILAIEIGIENVFWSHGMVILGKQIDIKGC